MLKIASYTSDASFSLSHAFLIYRPYTDNLNENIFYNNEILQILTFTIQNQKRKAFSSAQLCSLCSKWSTLLENNASQLRDGNETVHIIDTLESGRRFYNIKGLILSNDHTPEQIMEKRYLFILERMNSNSENIPFIARKFKLNKREQEIFHLLMEERSNKEIAQILSLSPNTIKCYIKILMRKLGVSSRAGIITSLLTKSCWGRISVVSIFMCKFF